ncbi:MAG: MaoC family dehydratase N-terminal domain-containing protein [Gammaproteobacteria bacterium]|nr:MaoC family dehydratase N-terminal domain-containing protein [Gammaproteobacteria bacterium]
MILAPELDIAHLRQWIGAEEVAQDVVTAALAERFAATIGLLINRPEEKGVAPRMLHLCLCQPAVPTDALGGDGHPVPGDFLPPVPLPRRMAAGSDMRFNGHLRVGDTVQRRSRIENVEQKVGRSGPLCFVTVGHSFSVEGTVVVTDRQMIVYRGDAVMQNPEQNQQVRQHTTMTGASMVEVDVLPPLLFRFSALTFNTHRIHYDRRYAVDVEGYPGLVVHGPLQATLLLYFAARQRGGALPNGYSYRSTAPAFDSGPLLLNATGSGDREMDLWITSAEGMAAMRARAAWE